MLASPLLPISWTQLASVSAAADPGDMRATPTTALTDSSGARSRGTAIRDMDMSSSPTVVARRTPCRRANSIPAARASVPACLADLPACAGHELLEIAEQKRLLQRGDGLQLRTIDLVHLVGRLRRVERVHVALPISTLAYLEDERAGRRRLIGLVIRLLRPVGAQERADIGDVGIVAHIGDEFRGCRRVPVHAVALPLQRQQDPGEEARALHRGDVASPLLHVERLGMRAEHLVHRLLRRASEPELLVRV